MPMKFQVHIEENSMAKPRDYELAAARIIARHFKSDIVFLRRASSKTPDLYILKLNIRWELKSPVGGSKYTIQNNLREASHQSENVILDLSRSKLSDVQGISRAKDFFNKEHSKIKRLKIITKQRKIVDIKG